MPVPGSGPSLPRSLSLGLLLCGAVALAAGCAQKTRPGKRPEHLILITVEGLRPDHMSAYLYNRRTTGWTVHPSEQAEGLTLSIDELATEGVVFAEAYTHAAAPLSGMKAVLCGELPDVRAPVEGLPEEVVTLAERLRAAGIRTGGFAGGRTLYGAGGFEQGFEQFALGRDDLEAARQALAWASLIGPGERMFLWLHLSGTTAPFEPGPFPPDAGEPHAALDYARLLMDMDFFKSLPASDYRALFARAPAPEGVDGSTAFLLAVARGERKLDAAGLASVIDLYDGEVAQLAALVRSFLIACRAIGLERGAWEDTALIFAGLHGVDLGDHGWLPSIHAGWMHVPLWMRHPASLPGKRIYATPVELADIAPTALAWLGVPRDDSAGPAGDPAARGRSLLTLLDGGPFERRRVLSISRAGDPRAALRDERWTFVWDGHGEQPRFELYDRRRDPRELRDVSSEELAEFERLQKELEQRLSSLVP